MFRAQELEIQRQRLVARYQMVGPAEQLQIQQQLLAIRQRQQYMQQQYSMAVGSGAGQEQRGPGGAYGHADAAAYEVCEQNSFFLLSENRHHRDRHSA